MESISIDLGSSHSGPRIWRSVRMLGLLVNFLAEQAMSGP